MAEVYCGNEVTARAVMRVIDANWNHGWSTPIPGQGPLKLYMVQEEQGPWHVHIEPRPQP